MKRSSRVLAAMAVLISTCVVFVPSASAAALPDLITSAVTNPPGLTWRGATFKVTDTVKNVGAGTAKGSTTRYYFSKDKVLNKGDVRFGTTRKLLSIKKGKTSKGSKTLTVPSTAAGARYYLLACSDDLKKVKEKSEKNNCRASKSTTLLDATKPAAPALSSTPPSPSNNTTPSVTTSAEANSTVRLFQSADCTGTPIATGTAAGGVFAFPVTVGPDSTTQYTATATDTAKNVSVCSTPFSYVNDQVPPGAPQIDDGTAPADPSADETPTWSFTGESNATFECRITGPNSYDSGFASCTNPKTHDLTDNLTFADGDYTFHVRQIDQAGNAGTDTDTHTFFMDSTPPSPPEITSAPSGTTNATTLSFIYSDPVETTTIFECKVTRDGVIVSDFAACGSGTGNHQFDQSTLAADDGAVYEFSVRQVDGVGNQSSADTASVTVDRFAPAPSVSGPPDPSNDDTPSWDISGEAGATFNCSLSRAGSGTPILTDVGCTDDFTHDLGSDPDDDYTMSVTQTDVHGNASAPATAVFTLDRAAPDAPTFGVTQPSDPTNDQTPEWAFSGETGATFECALYESGAPAGAGFDFASCTSPHLYDVGSLPDSTYTFRVRQTDTAGNPGPPADLAFTLDTQPPDAPALDSTPNTFDNDPNPVWTFSGEPQASFNCVLERGATTILETGCDSGTFTHDLGAEPDGTYTFSVSQTDAAGNEAATPISHDYYLDRGVPAAPTGLGVTPASPSNVDTPTVSGTAEAGSSVEVFSDASCTNSAGTGIAVGGTFAIPVSVAPDSSTVFAAKTTDAAGNTSGCSSSTVTYVEDSTAPGMPTAIMSTPNGPKNDNAPSVSGTAEAGSLVKIYSDASCTAPAFLGQGTAAGDGSFSIAVNVGDDTTTTFRATATDDATNASACSTSNDIYVEDSTPPAAPTLSGTMPASPNSEAAPEVLGSAEAGSVVRLYKSASCTGPEAGSGTASDFNLPGITVSVPANSSATIFGTATDEAGNISPCSSTSVLYENLLPEVEPNSTEAQATTVPDLNGDGEPDTTTTWTGLVSVADADYWKFTVPAGAGVRAETTDRTSAATCTISTDMVLYEETSPGVYVEVANDDDVDDGLNDCSLIDGSSSPPADSGASNLDGTYYLKVSTAVLADYRLILTLDSGEFTETEPVGSAGINDGSPTADGPIRGDRIIRGRLSTTTDRDFFKIELAEGAVVRFESFDLGLTEPFDPATADCVARPPQALALGTTVTWSGFGAAHPFQSTASGISGIGTCGAVVTWVPAGTSFISVAKGSPQALAIGDYALQVEVLDVGGTESEANDTPGTADVISGADAYVWGDHMTISDVDYWQFTVPEGKDVRVELIEGFDLSESTGSGTKEVCEGGGIASKITLITPNAGDVDPVGDDTGRGHSSFPTRRCSGIDGSGTTPEHAGASDLEAGTYLVKVEHGSPLSPASTEAQFVYRLAITIR